MTLLTIIGFIAVFVSALYVSFATVCLVFSELGFSGGLSSLSVVFVGVSLALWVLVGWLSPFTISVGVAA